MKAMKLRQRFLLLSLTALSVSGLAYRMSSPVLASSSEGGTETVVQYSYPKAHTQYDVYFNEPYSFSVQYPSDLVTPQSSFEEVDGREFISTDESFRMVAYGLPQGDQDLEEFYSSLLESHQERGSDITYTYLDATTFVISGNDPMGRIFHKKVMTQDSDFLVLGLEYEPESRLEFAPIAAEIVESFQSTEAESETAP